MKFSLSSLSLALSLCTAVQAGDHTKARNHARSVKVLQNNGYEVQTWRDNFLIFSEEYGDNAKFLDIMAFYPRCKTATIQLAKNDLENEHENKLSMTEIYNALAEEKGADPDEMRMVVFDVEKEDDETDELIAGIRESRNVGPWDEVKILPGEEEWDKILATEYYVKLLQVANRPVQRIIIRTRDLVDWWEKVVHTNRIFFSFGPLDKKTPVPGTSTGASTTEEDYEEVYEKDQEAIYMALIAEEDE